MPHPNLTPTEQRWLELADAALITELEFCAATFDGMGGSGPAHAARIRALLKAAPAPSPAPVPEEVRRIAEDRTVTHRKQHAGEFERCRRAKCVVARWILAQPGAPPAEEGESHA